MTSQTIDVTYSTGSREYECSCGWTDGGHVGPIRHNESRAIREHLASIHGVSPTAAGDLARRA